MVADFFGWRGGGSGARPEHAERHDSGHERGAQRLLTELHGAADSGRCDNPSGHGAPRRVPRQAFAGHLRHPKKARRAVALPQQWNRTSAGLGPEPEQPRAQVSL